MARSQDYFCAACKNEGKPYQKLRVCYVRGDQGRGYKFAGYLCRNGHYVNQGAWPTKHLGWPAYLS